MSTQEGWASAHIAAIVEDGIAARQERWGTESPVQISFCIPDEASFVVSFKGNGDSKDIHFLVRVVESDDNGELIEDEDEE